MCWSWNPVIMTNNHRGNGIPPRSLYFRRWKVGNKYVRVCVARSCSIRELMPHRSRNLMTLNCLLVDNFDETQSQMAWTPIYGSRRGCQRLAYGSCLVIKFRTTRTTVQPMRSRERNRVRCDVRPGLATSVCDESYQTYSMGEYALSQKSIRDWDDRPTLATNLCETFVSGFSPRPEFLVLQRLVHPTVGLCSVCW